MSVGFTDKGEEEMLAKGYAVDESELGRVYYPAKGIQREEVVVVKRMEYPWITCLEVEGIKIDKSELTDVM